MQRSFERCLGQLSFKCTLTPLPPLNPNPPGSFPANPPFLPSVLCLCYPQLMQTFWVFSWTTEPASSALHISNIPCSPSIIHRVGRCFPVSFDCLTPLGRWLSGKEHMYEDLNSHPHYQHKIQDSIPYLYPSSGERGFEQMGAKGMLVSQSSLKKQVPYLLPRICSVKCIYT